MSDVAKLSSEDAARGIILAAIRDEDFRKALVKYGMPLLEQLDIWERLEQPEITKLGKIDWEQFDLFDTQKWKRVAMTWDPIGEFLTDHPHWVPPGPPGLKDIVGKLS